MGENRECAGVMSQPTTLPFCPHRSRETAMRGTMPGLQWQFCYFNAMIDWFGKIAFVRVPSNAGAGDALPFASFLRTHGGVQGSAVPEGQTTSLRRRAAGGARVFDDGSRVLGAQACTPDCVRCVASG